MRQSRTCGFDTISRSRAVSRAHVGKCGRLQAIPNSVLRISFRLSGLTFLSGSLVVAACLSPSIKLPGYFTWIPVLAATSPQIRAPDHDGEKLRFGGPGPRLRQLSLVTTASINRAFCDAKSLRILVGLSQTTSGDLPGANLLPRRRIRRLSSNPRAALVECLRLLWEQHAAPRLRTLVINLTPDRREVPAAQGLVNLPRRLDEATRFPRRAESSLCQEFSASQTLRVL
jgi:hypothetical protein